MQMPKTLMAAALAIAFPAAFAQTAASSVELYGIVDVGLERVDVGTSNTRLQSGLSAGSRWGLRGRENLGGGYTAIFTLESRFEADTGSLNNNGGTYFCGGTATSPVCPGVAAIGLSGATAAAVGAGLNAVQADVLRQFTNVNSANAIFDRQAFAGLITPFGAVLLGRQYTPGYEVLNKFNSFGDATAGQMGQEFSTLTIRANNAVQYRAELQGVTLSLMYGFGGTEINRGERSTDPTRADDFYGANLQYATKTFSVGIGYNQNYVQTRRDESKAVRGMETLNIGGTMTLGGARLFAQYMTRKNDNPVVTPIDLQQIIVAAGGSSALIQAQLAPIVARANRVDLDGMRGFVGPTDTTVYHLGLTYRLGNGNLVAAYNNAKDTARSNWATEDAKVNHFALGYFYDLSRRTVLHATYAMAQNSGQSRMALGAAGYAGGWTTGFGQDATAIQAGIRHTF
ncbi:MAG: porin [Burkholderiaceae bacterium]|nr:porin [Burkholderiaceae bacterium]